MSHTNHTKLSHSQTGAVSRGVGVLVITMTDGLAWQVTRSLWMAGITVHVMGQLPGSMLERTVECTRYHRFSNIRREGIHLDLSMMDEAARVAEQNGLSIIMAADYVTNLLLARWARIGDNAKKAAFTPNPDAILQLHDKWELTKVLSRIGVPYPESEIAHNEADVLATRVPFPIITKPLDMASSKGVQFHASREALSRTVASGELFQGMPLIIQRFIPGDDIGYSFMAHNGKLLVSALCRQLGRGSRHYFLDQRMDEYVAELVAESNYSGVGHVDARYDPATDEYRLLEINPRFWASVLYVTKAGINFPQYLLRLSAGEAIEPQIPFMKTIRLSLLERTIMYLVRAVEISYFERGIVE